MLECTGYFAKWCEAEHLCLRLRNDGSDAELDSAGAHTWELYHGDEAVWRQNVDRAHLLRWAVYLPGWRLLQVVQASQRQAGVLTRGTVPWEWPCSKLGPAVIVQG